MSYRRKEPFHWWEFLLEFRTLAGEHYITNLMSIRTCDGKDREMLKRKREFALPERFTPAQLAEYNAFNDMFEAGG